MRIPLLTGLLLVSAWTTHAQTATDSNHKIPGLAASSTDALNAIPAANPTGTATFMFIDFPQASGKSRIYNETAVSSPIVDIINMPTAASYNTIQLYLRSINGTDTIVSSISGVPENLTSDNGDISLVDTPEGDFSIALNLQAILLQNGDSHMYFFALQSTQFTQAVTSPLFGVVKNAESDTSSFIGDLTGSSPATIQSGSSPASPTGSSKTSSSDSFVATASPSSSTTSGHGLATGAIAGIAVGAAVLLIIIAAIWFTLRHRKQRVRSHPADATTPLAAGYGGVAAAAVSRDFMAEKEAGAVVAESPQSRTYTDQLDPQHSATLSRAAVTAGPIAGPANASYTESGHQAYDDVGRALTDHQPPHARASSGRGLDSPVPEIGVARHLVDDDMTADEIARLEEEERELDRQIQEAGRRRR